MILPVILSGGFGRRLWPLSREQHPKQLLSLYNNKSLLQNTLQRLNEFQKMQSPIIVCNINRRYSIDLQVHELNLDYSCLILEPVSRGSAAAIALAALCAVNHFSNPILLVMPIDHYIKNCNSLSEAIKKGKKVAEANKIIAFGIKPEYADANYGYMESGEMFLDTDVFKVKKFIEKPTLETAEEFIKEEKYNWNSGIFMFRASQILEEMRKYSPEIIEACQEAIKYQYLKDKKLIINKNEFEKSPSTSIDYAVMEKSLNLVTTQINSEFTDIGSWKSLYRITEKDNNNNVTIGNVVALNTKNSYLRSDKRLIAAVGVNDIVVVDTPDAILVSDKESSQEISNMVSMLEEKNRPEAATSQQVYRLWGYYKIIESSTMYQIRNVCILPKNCISLQMHRYRGEHWVIISGQAKITRGDDILYLTENQSTYIPPKMVHSIENTSDEILELLEIQMGSYVNDDDVVRFETIYERGTQKFDT